MKSKHTGFLQLYITSRKYCRIFYQANPDRISTCPVTLHSLLHVADGIEAAGPVGAYWAFVMERFCGFLKRDGVRNRKKPYASLDNRVRHIAQLNVTKLRYNLVNLLSLENPEGEGGDVFPERACQHFSIFIYALTLPTDPQRVLMQPRKVMILDQDVQTALAKALVTRYSPLRGRKIAMFTAREYVPNQAVSQWGRVQIAEGGDRMCCRAILAPGSLGRDCTYVRVRFFIFKFDLLSKSDAAAHR